ncbi:MAG: ROK family protein [Candidatus Zixiibacteriota bacterium]|nr:MAG: ROK family protein [candidate division Zixibacteria bacterium]
MVEKGATALMHLVTNIGETLLLHAAEEDVEVRWVGVGTPGAVDYKTGTVVGQAPNIEGWQGMEIGRILKERLNTPVYVDNDVNAMALAEARFGSAVGYRSVVCVTIGTGVGGGIILGERLWRGATHAAGELGHISINSEGPECACGNRGCLEKYCQSSAIIERARRKLTGGLTPVFADLLDDSLDNLTIKKLFTAVKKKDAIAQEVIAETAELLGIGLAGVVNLLNPEIVVLGGGVADGGGGFVEMVAAAIRRRAFATATENLRVARASLGNDAGFIGAGLLGESMSL